jgi:hypothetical protein
MDSMQGRTPPRCPPNPKLTVSKEKTFRLQVRNTSEVFTALKFLFTKFFARGEDLSDLEHVLVDLLLAHLASIRSAQFGRQLLASVELQRILVLGRLYNTFRGEALPSWAQAQVGVLAKQRTFFDPRAFLGVEKIFTADNLIRVDNRLLRRAPRPPRRIGVGYRDKGTTQPLHIQGSPGWKYAVGNQPTTLKEQWQETCSKVPFELTHRISLGWS